MCNKESILEFLSDLSNIFGFRFGLAGSYSKGTYTDSSDIDIVTDNYLLLEDIEYIKSSIYNKFQKNSDILSLDLLKKEDEDLDKFMLSMGLGTNEDSVYKTISREVIWNG